MTTEINIEEKLSIIWIKLFDIPNNQIQNNTNLISLGADSILISQLYSETFDTFGIELSLNDLFDNPTFENNVLLIKQSLTLQKETEIFSGEI